MKSKAVQFQYVPASDRNHPTIYVLLDDGTLWLKVWTGREEAAWSREPLPGEEAPLG
jgi:hypothetical protein